MAYRHDTAPASGRSVRTGFFPLFAQLVGDDGVAVAGLHKAWPVAAIRTYCSTKGHFAPAAEADSSILQLRRLPPAQQGQYTIRFDAEILDGFKATGDGWQTPMNVALKEWLQSRQV